MFSKSHYETIVSFLETIGIPVHERKLMDTCFLPGIFMDRGKLLVDTRQLKYAGDMLHEAGHIAVMPPSARRERIGDAGADQAEEIAAHAWSYAAAVYCDIPPEAVFHEHGYQGNGSTMAGWYKDGHWPGVPILAWVGLTGMPEQHGELGRPKFPEMKAWMRQIEDPTQLID